MPSLVRFVPFGLLILGLASSFADAPKGRQFALPGHGQLQLLIPDSWQAEVRQPPGQLPPTITLGPGSGAPFQILITPVWPMRAGAQLPDVAAIRDEVATTARGLEPQSVEKTLTVHDFGGVGNQGYFFAATDPAPKPGEFKFLTQGIVHLGGVNLAFTILTNDGQTAVVPLALEMLRSASQALGGT